ncbi:bifunctional phosphopantothenoylcysteine decarboxylase/phosphopantothenate--cysteine ligase CoaBC [soil metagenome]
MTAQEPAETRGILHGRLIVLGVTGSIAAYKSVGLARALIRAGADVQVLMTHAATRFLGPLTMETLTGRAVQLDPLELLPDQRIAHIAAAESADAIVVAPATARWLGAMANGLADDVVTAVCLASAAPVIVAPAMDGEMYAHPATRRNVETLRDFGYAMVDPEVGPLASGAVGQGRLAETDAIVAAVSHALEVDVRGSGRDPTAASEGSLAGRHIVVTAGGTAEPIDPVRFIGNHSTGRMGMAVAEAALARGASVTLICGSVSVPAPAGATVLHAPTTEQMRRQVHGALADADALVMAAAVADFRPRRAADRKLSRTAGLTLDLEPTPDILAEAVARIRSSADGVRQATGRGRTVVIGFAAETGSLDRISEKAARKGVDLLVANDVTEQGSGFGTDTNRVTVVAPDTEPESWPLLGKSEVAERLLDRVEELMKAGHLATQRAPGDATA